VSSSGINSVVNQF
jgi:hypothetical protein